MHFLIGLAACPLFLTLAIPQASADPVDLFAFPDRVGVDQLERQRSALYARHLDCASAAATRELAYDEVASCGEVFLRLKLSFLPGSDVRRFRSLSAPSRALANRKGYAAYRAWVHRNAALAPIPEERYPRATR